MILTHHDKQTTTSAFWVGITMVFVMGVGLFIAGCDNQSHAAETYSNELDTKAHMINLLNQPTNEEITPGFTNSINSMITNSETENYSD